MRARVARWVLWLLAIGCLWLPILDDPPLRSGAYLQDLTASRITVAMITAAPCQLTCTVRDAAGAVVATASDTADRRHHRLVVEGLSAGADYEYEVAAAGERLDAGRFRTPPTEDSAPVRFAVCGDSGKQPWWVWLQTAPILHLPARWEWLPPAGSVAAVGRAMAEFEPDFLLHVGDVVYPRGEYRHYGPGFFRPFAEALRNAPFYPVLGNHDVMDMGGLQLLANFALPTNPITGDGRSYSFGFGAVGVICLEFNDMLTGLVTPGHPSLVFLEAELKRRSEPWLVVASHFPIRSASRQGGRRPDLMLHLWPLLDDYAVSLYVSGHDHCYQRFTAERDGARTTPLVVTGGGGKSLYAVQPTPGAEALASEFHWVGVEVERARLRLVATALDGRVLDELNLDLHVDDRLERLRERNPGRAARIDALRH